MLFFGKRKSAKSEPKLPNVRTDSLRHIVLDLTKYAQMFGPDGNVYFVFVPKHKRWLCGITKSDRQSDLVAPWGSGATPIQAARDALANAQKK